MKKRKILCLFLSLAVVVSCMPFFTLQSDAFSTGSKTLLKTRTVTIKPGKTYKSPAFKMSKKMAIQVPVKMWPKKVTNYGFKLKYTMTLKNAKGKTKGYYKCPACGIYNVYTDQLLYDNWVYFYNKLSSPGFAKGKYYITIKNTSKQTIKVKYSVRGYTKLATTGEMKKELVADYIDMELVAGKIGPGLPIIKSIESDNPNIKLVWTMSADGVLRIYPTNFSQDPQEATITVTLKKGNVKLSTKLKMDGEPVDGFEDDEDDEVDDNNI